MYDGLTLVINTRTHTYTHARTLVAPVRNLDRWRGDQHPRLGREAHTGATFCRSQPSPRTPESSRGTHVAAVRLVCVCVVHTHHRRPHRVFHCK